MVLKMEEIGGGRVLAGATKGKEVLGKLIAGLPTVQAPEVLVLDFDGVQVATGSFVRESVLAFQSYCRKSQSGFYPVVANASPEVLEELQCVLKDRGEAVVVCRFADGRCTEARVLGMLEEKQQFTLAAVVKAGETDAAQLHEEFQREDSIAVTGWNNRLAALSAKGLLMELRHGRSKRYKPVLEGIAYGY